MGDIVAENFANSTSREYLSTGECFLLVFTLNQDCGILWKMI